MLGPISRSFNCRPLRTVIIPPHELGYQYLSALLAYNVVDVMDDDNITTDLEAWNQIGISLIVMVKKQDMPVVLAK